MNSLVVNGVFANFLLGLVCAGFENWRGFAMCALTVLTVGVFQLISIKRSVKVEQ